MASPFDHLEGDEGVFSQQSPQHGRAAQLIGRALQNQRRAPQRFERRLVQRAALPRRTHRKAEQDHRLHRRLDRQPGADPASEAAAHQHARAFGCLAQLFDFGPQIRLRAPGPQRDRLCVDACVFQRAHQLHQQRLARGAVEAGDQDRLRHDLGLSIIASAPGPSFRNENSNRSRNVFNTSYPRSTNRPCASGLRSVSLAQITNCPSSA